MSIDANLAIMQLERVMYSFKPRTTEKRPMTPTEKEKFDSDMAFIETFKSQGDTPIEQ